MYLKSSESHGSVLSPVLFCRIPETLRASQSPAVSKSSFNTSLGLFPWLIDRVLTVRVHFQPVGAFLNVLQ